MNYGSGSFAGDKKDIHSDIKAAANSEKAAILARFFKTGPGEYGEGDKFHGIVVPQCRQIAKTHVATMSIDAIIGLLHSDWHEERQIALFMLTHKFSDGDESQKRNIFEIFLKNTNYINNWDLVDINSPTIVGQYIYEHPRLLPLLDKLASSKLVWDRRIAVISTFYFIAKGDPGPTLNIVKKLLNDDHDLIQKASGWMLREVGKRIDNELLIQFLKKHYTNMPRTTLRYAIEKFSPQDRSRFLSGKF
ncbi:DNA alkylation repair protein [Candidatus Saccharibacteria bacterium]|nr:DNA alkylation repair protein [Candidatus Saccharibacteria bacterium]